MKFIKLLPLTALIALPACLQDAATLSGFANPSSNGSISSGLSDASSASFIDSSGDGFAYASGSIDGEGLKAVAGLVAGTNVTPHNGETSAIYSGRYELVNVSIVDFDTTSISGFQTQRRGNINLNVNFDAGTLTGASDNLSINGRFAGETLTGGVSYHGVAGDLQGLVGSDKAVGAFHGNDKNRIYAGGFLVTPN